MALYDQALDSAQAQRCAAFPAADRATDASGRRRVRRCAFCAPKRSRCPVARLRRSLKLRWLATHGYHYAFWERNTFANARPPTRNSGPARRTQRATANRPAKIARDDPHRSMRRSNARRHRCARCGLDHRLDGKRQSAIESSASGTATVAWRESEPSRRMLGVRNDAHTQGRVGVLDRTERARTALGAPAHLAAAERRPALAAP